MKPRSLAWKMVVLSALLAQYNLLPAWAEVAPLPAGEGIGSGFFVTSNGYFVTCCHIIKSAQDLLISSGGKTWPAKVAAFDVESDVALLKVKSDTGFPCLPLDDPQNLAPGS